MFGLKLDGVRSILCLGAHSDDIEIGCGGTMLKLLAAHPEVAVHWVVLSGDDRRRREATESAGAYLTGAGKHSVITRKFRDSYFPFQGERIKEFFAQMGGEISPDLIFTHRRDDAHQDHRLVAELTWCAFRNHTILEYEIPKYDGDLGVPNLYVPLAETVCRTKVDNLMRHFPTQAAKPWFTTDTFRSLLRIRGLESNSPSGQAEGFYCRKLTLA